MVSFRMMFPLSDLALAQHWAGGAEQNNQPSTGRCPLKSQGIIDIRFPFLALFPTAG